MPAARCAVSWFLSLCGCVSECFYRCVAVSCCTLSLCAFRCLCRFSSLLSPAVRRFSSPRPPRRRHYRLSVRISLPPRVGGACRQPAASLHLFPTSPARASPVHGRSSPVCVLSLALLRHGQRRADALPFPSHRAARSWRGPPSHRLSAAAASAVGPLISLLLRRCRLAAVSRSRASSLLSSPAHGPVTSPVLRRTPRRPLVGFVTCNAFL